ncbi:MAG: hypothetical protein IPK79_03465 [Vampirovibrionales bacterium]|nr:hypothetical protein [Vampirovibrionales bacterium]
MNFAVGVIDDPTCLSCLGKEFQRSEAAMAAYCWRYIQQRECFLTPWQAFDPSPCPRREGLNADCPCDREATPGNETPLP